MFLNILTNVEIIAKYAFAREQDFARYVSWLKQHCGKGEKTGLKAN
jgi:hypothetical protein